MKRFTLVFKRIYRQIDGKERTRWYTEICRVANLAQAMLWLAGYAGKRDWRNSQIEIVAIVKIEGDDVVLVDVPEDL